MNYRISEGKFLFLVVLAMMALLSYAQEDTVDPAIVEGNQQCLVCHGHVYFTYYNEWVERDVKERMNPYYIIDSASYYISNHKTFNCTDCHSSEYETSFPHPNDLRFEPQFVCMDCHEGDDSFAEFHFERINEEYLASVHSEKHSEEFTCWMCHNPHSYKISARETHNLLETIQYDNAICLDCHMNQSRFELLSDRGLFNMLDRHDWLPNQRAHFQNVRCIECHTEISDSVLIAHKVLPKEFAVKLCVECHSSNSILLATLYKYEAIERRDDLGFVNAVILTKSYVIGANRNFFLNVASLAIFGFILLGIIFHAVLRKLTSK